MIGIWLKTILKIRNNRFYKNFYSKDCRILHVFDTLSRYFWGKINIEYTSENINCCNFKKNWVIDHNEGKRVTIWLVFMVMLSNKIMQNHQKLPPKRGKGNLPWWCGNGEQVIPIYGVRCDAVSVIQLNISCC